MAGTRGGIPEIWLAVTAWLYKKSSKTEDGKPPPWKGELIGPFSKYRNTGKADFCAEMKALAEDFGYVGAIGFGHTHPQTGTPFLLVNLIDNANKPGWPFNSLAQGDKWIELTHLADVHKMQLLIMDVESGRVPDDDKLGRFFDLYVAGPILPPLKK